MTMPPSSSPTVTVGMLGDVPVGLDREVVETWVDEPYPLAPPDLPVDEAYPPVGKG